MENKFKPVPFWSWNDDLQEDELVRQIDWMNESGIGGFFMHARGGLTTPYLGEKWFSCVDACLKRAKELNMEAYAYDENGWPSGFVGGKLLENEEDRDAYLEYKVGPYDSKSYVSYDISTDKLIRTTSGDNVLNVYFFRSNSTADICNKNTVRKFINMTHEEYKKRDKYNNLRGFFTDEPQYQRWHHAYTPCMVEYFKEHYNMDIKDKLGLMFVEKEGYRDFRYKYWSAMQQLMLGAFAEQVYNWCDQNHYILTGHYVEEASLGLQMADNAGIMSFYAYEHIPGMDWLKRDIGTDFAPRQVGSVAAQMGREQVLTESFALAGWDATPQELKHIFEWQAVSGNVSLLCHHLLPYSEWGQRKRDYPEHYSAVNPWAKDDFKLFNDQITFIGKTISNSSEEVHIAVMHPIRSCYLNYKRDMIHQSVSELQHNIDAFVNKMSALHIPYHFIDETLLKRFGKAEGNKIVLGKCSYDTLIFPLIYTMDKYTEEVIRKFVKAGGKVLLTESKPTYLEGEPYEYDYLESNTTLEEILAALPFKASENKNIRISYRKDKETRRMFFYIVNLGDATEFTLNGCHYYFKKWESRFIDEQKVIDDTRDNKKVIHLDKSFKVVNKPLNYLTLDTVAYSKDGNEYANPIPVMGLFNKLLVERYQGDLFLKYTFECKNVPNVCKALIEDQNIKSVRINGYKVEKEGFVLEKNLRKFDIAQYIKKGQNEVVVNIDFYENETVYYALFGENVTESLVNCLVYPTTIEAIYLQGDFGVFGQFEDGKEDGVLIGKNFYLDNPKDKVSCLIKDGYPFFRGNILLEQDIKLEDSNVVLNIPERFALIELTVNGMNLGKHMFENDFDLSEYVKPGKNRIQINLMVSNRNLLGPAHNSWVEESHEVTPYSFEMKGAWKSDGTSDAYRDTYSFVKTII